LALPEDGKEAGGGVGLSAKLYNPAGLAIDPAGNLYIATYTSNVVRQVTPAGTISTFAGDDIPTTGGFSGDGGAPAKASLDFAIGVAADSSSNIYIMDSRNERIRKITYQSQPGLSAPVFSPAAGTYTSTQTVTLTPSDSGATTYYTTDGSTPTTASARGVPEVGSHSDTANLYACRG
jgi:hypothetical protein